MFEISAVYLHRDTKRGKYADMLHRELYENDILALGIENQEERTEIIQSLYNLVLLTIKSIANEKEQD